MQADVLNAVADVGQRRRDRLLGLDGKVPRQLVGGSPTKHRNGTSMLERVDDTTARRSDRGTYAGRRGARPGCGASALDAAVRVVRGVLLLTNDHRRLKHVRNDCKCPKQAANRLVCARACGGRQPANGTDVPGASAQECSAWSPALPFGKMIRLKLLSHQRLVPSPWKRERAMPE